MFTFSFPAPSPNDGLRIKYTNFSSSDHPTRLFFFRNLFDLRKVNMLKSHTGNAPHLRPPTLTRVLRDDRETWSSGLPKLFLMCKIALVFVR